MYWGKLSLGAFILHNTVHAAGLKQGFKITQNRSNPPHTEQELL